METLKRSRGGFRAAMTKLLQRLELAITNLDQATVEELHEQLTEREEKLKAVNQQILDEMIDKDATEQEIADEIDASDEWMRAVVRDRKKAEKTLATLAMSAQAAIPPSSPSRHVLSSSVIAGTSAQNVKLPKLEIKKFSGDLKDWERFWGQFQASIHSNPNVAEVQKFAYLQSLLEGVAGDAISGLALTAVNYSIAIDTLKQRFGQKDLIVHAHMTHLLQLEALRADFDVQRLRKLYDDCVKQTQSLEALGVAVDNYSALLCPVVLKLLPEVILQEWNRKAGANAFHLKDLMTFLKTEVEGRERTAYILSSASTAKGGKAFLPKSPFTNEGKEGSKPSTSALLAEVQQPNLGKERSAVQWKDPEDKPKVNMCVFCLKAHNSWDCDSPGSIDDVVSVARKNGLCFQCLRGPHLARWCTRSRCPRCNGRHHLFLCRAIQDSGYERKDTAISLMQNVSNTLNFRKSFALMKKAHAWLESGSKLMQSQCVLDDGSQRSFIRQRLVTELGLKGLHDEVLSVQGFGGHESTHQTFSVVRVKLREPHEQKYVCDIDLLVVPEIATFPPCHVEDFNRYLEEKSLLPAVKTGWKFPSNQIDVLIGLDYYWRILTGENQVVYEGLVASESRLGWIINGNVNCSESELGTSNEELGISDIRSMLTVVPTTEQWISNCWNLDVLGITDSEVGKGFSEEDLRVQYKFEETIEYVNGRYRVRLPWKGDMGKLASNWEVAQQRLVKQINGFKKDECFFNKYQQAMQEYVNNKHVEEAPPEFCSDKLYFLPHHAVIKEDRLTTKCRIVFDASSSRQEAASLNDCLSIGPNLNPNLIGLLLRFRLHQIAFVADIEKAFLQVELHPEDRDATRFLWFGESWKPGDLVTLKQYRMTRVLFGASSSPYLLAATIRYHLQTWPNVSDLVRTELDRNVYMDDYLSGGETNEAAYELAKESRSTLKFAGMSLKKWTTNSMELYQKWLEDDPEEELNIQNPDSNQKILGVMWHPTKDVFSLQVKGLDEVLRTEVVNKRVLLQASARIFDPLGFVCPLVIKIRALFQDVWKLKLGWRTELPDELKMKWAQIKQDLQQLGQLVIPRWVDFGEGNSSQIHVFCDASQTAFGAVAYVRRLCTGGFSRVSFLAAKSRLAPLKSITMPRLELLGSLMGARLSSFICASLNIEAETYLWSDSTIVLHWVLGSSKKLDPFVTHRVEEIQKLSKSRQWRYCRSNDNPADLLSRGEQLEKLKCSSLWWHGPSWLSLPEESWPEQIIDKRTSEAVMLVQSKKDDDEISLLDLSAYSSLWRVIRITAWVLRFVKQMRTKSELARLELQVSELDEAMQYWIRHVQRDCFPKDLSGTGTMSSMLKPFNPYLDEHGILRIGGRLRHATFSDSIKHPIILPGSHQFVRMLIRQHHLRLLHAGVCDTLSDLRERYWILKARQVVKREINDCLVCKRLRVKPMQVLEGQLPKERVTEAPPFHVSGTDFAGPVYVKMKDGTSKAYILIFTCAVTRAVHLEAVSSLKAEDFLLGFRRFVSRRGLCRILYSDNAKTFYRANKDLQKLWKGIRKNLALLDYFGKRGISWRYIVERAAWWGGFWERMVKSVKICLKRVLGQACLNFEELSTVLAEVEAVLNSRPLTLVYDDVQDPFPLTPGHFLIGKRIASLPDDVREGHVSTQTSLRRRWIYCQRLTNEFWKRWHTQYLQQLRSAQQQHGVATKVPKIQAGDLVLVAENKTPRHLWPLGIVVEVFRGRDKLIRSCSLRMKGSKTVIRRPIQLLCQLEC